MKILLGLLLAAVAGAAACVGALPDQDLRIGAATPQFKISADLLWKDYQKDAKAANRQYHGKAVLVTGIVTGVEKSAGKYVLFGQVPDKPIGVQANLLLDTADQVLTGVDVRQHVVLKCFCDGLATNLILKSCVKP